MLVYSGIKSDFINDVDLNVITDKIYERYQMFFGRTGKSQINSWKESMLRMRGVLADKDIPNNSGVAIEYNIPTTSKRIDFILSGKSKEEKKTIIIIELKQWENCEEVEGKDGLVKTYTGGAEREVPHPSYQAFTYASLIKSFNQTVTDERIELYPCAFLHNYDIKENDPISNIKYKEYIDEAPMFGSKDFNKLRDFIKLHITTGDNREGLYKIENGKIKPSKMLQDAFANVLRGKKEFYMIDEQKIIYEEAMSLGIDTISKNEKNVLIIEGGPGTGKSVLAINLLNDFMQRNMTSFYVTKNSSPRAIFKSKLKIEKLSSLNNLFQSSGVFTDTQPNTDDVLIVDEAHRLMAKSGMFHNKGENQVKEIINAAKFSIFFIDENQKVTLNDIGSVDVIKKYANELNAGIKIMKLESQFRCNGSDGYISWLDNLLDIRKTANFNDMGLEYDFKVIDDPNQLRKMIEEKNYNNKARLVAGYCWDWINDGNSKNDSNIYDIAMPQYNFNMSWNLGNSQTWAIDATSVNEIGCIHTCQGLEFDYIGVIIGDDLRLENNKIVTDYTKRAKTDQSLKGIKKIAKEKGERYAQKIAEPIIKNTYRTLMTRGMKGCYVYCTNKTLAEYIRQRLNNTIN